MPEEKPLTAEEIAGLRKCAADTGWMAKYVATLAAHERRIEELERELNLWMDTCRDAEDQRDEARRQIDLVLKLKEVVVNEARKAAFRKCAEIALGRGSWEADQAIRCVCPEAFEEGK